MPTLEDDDLVPPDDDDLVLELGRMMHEEAERAARIARLSKPARFWWLEPIAPTTVSELRKHAESEQRAHQNVGARTERERDQRPHQADASAHRK